MTNAQKVIFRKAQRGAGCIFGLNICLIILALVVRAADICILSLQFGEHLRGERIGKV